MPLAPATIVRLCRCPFDKGYQHQILFQDRATQAAYFASYTRKTFTDFSYQRQDNTIRVPVHIDHLWNCNYVMYDNANFTDRWFYAFIEKLTYVNDNCTLIHIKTDVFQTWFLDCRLLPCFVEREHAANE